MEINFSLDKFVKVSDKTLPENVLNNLIKICKESKNFKNATIIKNNKGDFAFNPNIRKTLTWSMHNVGVESLTEVHWANLLQNVFIQGIRKYQQDLDINHNFELIDIQILKYNVGGHYRFHVDHASSISRTFSCIFLLNDDYEGGDLLFKFPNGGTEMKIEKVKNRLIIWPSNFLYPHSVLPVTNGERYSVVAWAL
jgi:hypothetical protein